VTVAECEDTMAGAEACETVRDVGGEMAVTGRAGASVCSEEPVDEGAVDGRGLLTKYERML
jgi:hypothetical protein